MIDIIVNIITHTTSMYDDIILYHSVSLLPCDLHKDMDYNKMATYRIMQNSLADFSRSVGTQL